MEWVPLQYGLLSESKAARVTISFYPVILSGGSGSRLWPMSRRLLPKQFLPLVSQRTMLQDTVLRLQGVEGSLAPIVVSNDEHRFLVAEQMREIGVKSEVQILEPVGRNTAPAIAVVALHLQSLRSDACMLALPSDHLILDVPAFHAAVATALPLAAGGALVTFGITPQGPVTGYGYIERGEPISRSEHSYRVKRFVEKPDLETAQRYVSSGQFFWRSCSVSAPRFWPRQRPRGRPASATSISCGWIQLHSPPVRRTPSTMPSWSAPPRARWSRPTSAGAMSARGLRFGRPEKRTRAITSCAATWTCAKQTVAIFAPSTAWSRRWVCAIS